MTLSSLMPCSGTVKLSVRIDIMGKKKEPTISDAVENFKSSMTKVGFNSFIRYNRNLYSINKNRKYVIAVPDENLYMELIKDPCVDIRELDLNNKDDRRIQPSFQFVEEMDDNGWVEIDSEKMRNNEMVSIQLDGFPYPIELNNKIFIFRLKKDDYNNFFYKLSMANRWFAVKKYFKGPVDSSGFWIVRGFHII